MILEGDYHYKTRSFLTSFYGKKVLKIAPDNDFINTKVDLNNLPPPNAIFTTKSDRNLNFLLDAWHQIKKKSIQSKLFINPPHLLTDINVQDDVIKKLLQKLNEVQDLKDARTMKNTIDVIAKFEYDFYTAQSNFIFYKEMSTDSRIREESLKADEKFEDKETDAWMDTKLYEAINNFK